MATDLFEFWSRIGPSERIHPADRDVFERVNHNFSLDCLPGCFFGPLKTAPVVLLYLSPGFDEKEIAAADDPEMQRHMVATRAGTHPLAGPDEYPARWKWWSSRTRRFGDWRDLRTSIAVLNIGAYHSKDFADAPLLAALPSSRVVLSWAQEVLFPQAIRGERVVICLRARRFWGLDGATHFGAALYSPPTTIGGHMLAGPERQDILDAVARAIGHPRRAE